MKKYASKKEIVDCIMEGIAIFPDECSKLTEEQKKRAYWDKLLNRNSPHHKALLDVLSELPVFTTRRPKKPSVGEWRKLLAGTQPVLFSRFIYMIIRVGSYTPPAKLNTKIPIRELYKHEDTFQRFRPAESDEYLPNPHRGTATFQRFQGEAIYPFMSWSDEDGPRIFPKKGKIKKNIGYIPDTTIAYCRCPWAWMEVQKGVYCWDVMDNSLKSAREAGQTLQFRFQPYVGINLNSGKKSDQHLPPGRFADMPLWYWREGNYILPAKPTGVTEPDSNHPDYIKHFGDFIRAFAKRYDGHPDLESVDAALAGFYGEAGGNASKETLAKLTNIFVESFKKTQLLFMVGAGIDYAMQGFKDNSRFGWRADCFGDMESFGRPNPPAYPYFAHTYDFYPRAIAQAGAENAWKTSPVVMETCWDVATWVADDLDIDAIIHEGYRYHTSIFMPKSVYIPEKVMDKFIRFDKYIGYRFVIRQFDLPLEAVRGKSFNMTFFLDNVGCAPIYRDYRLAIKLTQGKKSFILKPNSDLRKWLPGHVWFEEKFKIPATLESGRVYASTAIVDAADNPVVRFANVGKLESGWLPCGYFEVK